VVRAGGGHTLVHPSIVAETGDAMAIRVYPPSMRGRLVLAWLAVVCTVVVACGDGDKDRATDQKTDGPLTATVTARGLTAGLLDHLDRGQVTSYGGYHDDTVAEMETWMASVDLDTDIRTVDVFVQRLLDSYDSGCKPDDSYSELSCTPAPNKAQRSLMQRISGDDQMPLLQGRTTRADGTPILVQLWADDVTDDARALVLELLDDETLGALTTDSLNAAGESLDDYQELELKRSTGWASP
jgi:hypothetical protein